MTKIVIFSDASSDKQINGVKTTINMTKKCLIEKGYDVSVVGPDKYSLTIPLQPSTGIYMPIMPLGLVEDELKDADCIHIATEGAIGLAARYACKKQQRKYTTSFHTKFPEYLYEHAGIPPRISSLYFRWFHRSSSCVMVTTPPMVDYCNNLGIRNVKIWSRGVDTELFKPYQKPGKNRSGLIRAVYVGRVSAEKNIESFLSIGSPNILKCVVGDGPQLEEYKYLYPETLFTGKKTAVEIAVWLKDYDVFAWPSLTDTFGLVILEAMACGLPIAAFDNDVNRYIIQDNCSGILAKNDLESAIIQAAWLDPNDAIKRAKEFSWEKATDQFIENLA